MIRMSKKKNKSKKFPDGTIIHTQDNYLYGADGNSKKGRYGIVVDSNIFDELGIAKITHSQKQPGIALSVFDGKSRVQAGGLYIKDNNGKPIKISSNGHFRVKKSKGKVNKRELNKIKRMLVTNKRFGKSNRQQLHKLKGRK